MNAVINYFVNNFMASPVAFSISTVALILEIVIFQFRGMKAIVIGQCISNFLVFLTFLLGDGLSGAVVCIIATVQTFLIYWMYQRKGKNVSVVFAVIFLVIYLLSSVLTFKGPVDIIAIVAALLFGLSVVQSQSWKYRIIILANSLLWLAYSVIISAPIPTVITYIIAVTSIIVGIIRMDIKQWFKKA